MKSMLVEINTLDEKHMRIFDFMRDQVGGYSWSEEQINRVRQRRAEHEKRLELDVDP